MRLSRPSAGTTRRLITLVVLVLAFSASGCTSSEPDDGSQVATLADEVADGEQAQHGEDEVPANDDPRVQDGTPTEADYAEFAARFDQCMEDNGFYIPDPEELGTGGELSDAELEKLQDMGPEKFYEVSALCQEELSEIIDQLDISFDFDPNQQVARDDALVEYTQCMDDHGLIVTIPMRSDGVIEIRVEQEDGATLGGEGFDYDAYHAADQECGNPLETGIRQEGP